MVERAILKIENDHIFATIWLIGVKFGMIIYIGPLNHIGS